MPRRDPLPRCCPVGGTLITVDRLNRDLENRVSWDTWYTTGRVGDGRWTTVNTAACPSGLVVVARPTPEHDLEPGWTSGQLFELTD